MVRVCKIAVVAGLAAGVPTLGLSEGPITISDCEYSQSYGPDTYYEGHKDIGGGFVTYSERSKYGTTVIVADCVSGSTLEIDSTGQNPADVKKYVLTSAKSPEKVTLSTLREHFSTLKLWTNLSVQRLEHCACAAFYPEAKGKKGDWKIRLNHPPL